MTLRKLLSLPLLLVLLAAGGIGVAHAQDPIAWAIATVDGEHGQGRPNFGYEAAPGTVITDAINVTNTGIENLELAVYAADGFTTSSGTLDLLPAGEPSTGVGVWTVPSVTSLALEPGDSVDVPFTITVPADAAPGDHTGGIITSWSTGGSGSIESEHRSAMRIHISVPGERVAELSVTDVTVEVVPELLDGTRGEPVVVTETVTVIPWGALVSLLVVIGVGVGVAVWRHRSNYEWIEVPDDAPGKPEEEPQAPAENPTEE